jgi:hypothetical protein
VLRAIAIAALAPALITGGFVAYRLVRRDAEGRVPGKSLLKLLGILDESERSGRPPAPVVKAGRRAKPKDLRQHQFLARLNANSRSQVDQLTLESTPNNLSRT